MAEVTEARTRVLFSECIAECRRLMIPISGSFNPLVFGNAKSSWGSCKCIKKGQSKSYQIRISRMCLKCGESAVRTTLMHELLHSCEGCSNHGSEWKKWAAVLNRHGYNISRTTSLKEKAGGNEDTVTRQLIAEGAIVLQCEKCRNKFFRQRESKLTRNPDKYRCKCGGKIMRLN